MKSFILFIVFSVPVFCNGQDFIERSVLNSSGRSLTTGSNVFISSFGEPVSDMQTNTQTGFIQVFTPVIISVVPEVEQRMSVYPNPIVDILNLETEKNIQFIKVFDCLGNLVTEKTICEKRTSLNFSSFAPGLYILLIRLENHNVVLKKVIKN